ncbi:hypothetical protein BC827DRAFT_1155936 [Russula dissimulans]|nr:hypothetical protein BC827DRAFT_1155936 [Russula dissimulans]
MPSLRPNIGASLLPRPATLLRLSLYILPGALPALATPMIALGPRVSPAPSNLGSSSKTTQIVFDVIFSLGLCDTFRSFMNTLSSFRIDYLLERAANTWAVDGTNNPGPIPHTPAVGDTPTAVQVISRQPESPPPVLQPGEATATPGSASAPGCTSATSDNGDGPSSAV